MASNNPPNKDSAEGNTSGSRIASLPRGLLSKDGRPISKSERLASSVRPARDLTLGGAQRKSFKPTIPVRPKDKATSGLVFIHTVYSRSSFYGAEQIISYS